MLIALLKNGCFAEITLAAMIVTLVHVYVKSDFVESFVEATKINHELSIKEIGNFRFDVLQDAEVPEKFVLYEAYESESAAVAHKQTSHYAVWRDTVAPWMEKPRQGIKHTMLFP